MATETVSQITETRTVNPYLRTLFVVLCVTVASAVILGLTALSAQRPEQAVDPDLVSSTIAWSGVFWALSFATLLAWLVGSANAWKARA